MNLDYWFSKNLEQRKEKGLLRELKVTEGLTDFCSNDYLGLARSESLFNLINQKLASQKLKLNGATGSRLLSGNDALTEETENQLASIFKSESCLIFNSGYTANLAILSSIPQKGDTIIYDELAHACIKDGARLSFANRYSFRHNDLNDLEEKIKRSNGKIFIAVESVYSMDGDECPLVELTELAARYHASILLDEAHSTGIFGEKGSGLAVHLGVEKKIDIRTYTFGKAMGCHGACVAGTKLLTDYLINFARPFIYTTALPPHSIVSISTAFEFLNDNIHLQNRLAEKIDLFRSVVQGTFPLVNSRSAIQAAIKPGNENVRAAASSLQRAGYDVRPILSPTVPQGEERLRICLHVYNTDEEISKLAKLLESVIN